MRPTIKGLRKILHIGEDVDFLLEWTGLRPRDFVVGTISGIIIATLKSLRDTDPIDLLLYGIVSLTLVMAFIAFIRLSFGIRWVKQPKEPGADQPAKIVEITADPTPDIDASKSFWKILQSSEWSAEQQRITTDTSHLVYNWQEVRLSGEIHNALRNSRLMASGQECLPGTATTPEKPIPPETWDTVEIVFDQINGARTAAYFKGRISRERGRMAWVGVKFSSKQIFDLFPLIRRISLLEAATIAHERLRYKPIAISTEVKADSPDDVLIAYCNLLTRMHGRQQPLVILYGMMPPARVLEPINLIEYRHFDFISEGGTIILQERYGKRQCNNLVVATKELEAAIEELSSREG